MYEILLPVHIFAGFCSLLSACIAILTSKGQPWHVYSGRIFFGGMLVIFMTAIPMTLLRPNVFLFLVAIFSFYQALTGWRAARNRSGRPAPIDWTAAGIMTLAGVGMIVFGTSLLLSGNTMGIVMLVFGSLGGSSGVYDLRQLRREPLTGKKRIAAHLSRMFGWHDCDGDRFCGDQFSVLACLCFVAGAFYRHRSIDYLLEPSDIEPDEANEANAERSVLVMSHMISGESSTQRP